MTFKEEREALAESAGRALVPVTNTLMFGGSWIFNIFKTLWFNGRLTDLMLQECGVLRIPLTVMLHRVEL